LGEVVARIIAYRPTSLPLSTSKARKELELAARRSFSVLGDLTGIFLPKDPLLASSGVVPVYYWFIRDLKARDYSRVRDFLVHFEEDRRKNRRKAEEGSTAGVDRQLLEYDQFNRNTNDLTSHIGRIDILKKKFAKFSG
jgi:hypothetical protein